LANFCGYFVAKLAEMFAGGHRRIYLSKALALHWYESAFGGMDIDGSGFS
jgi:hypothetical protein